MNRNSLILVAIAGLLSTPAFAHDPVFSPGPHVIYKGGVETALHYEHSKQGDEKENGMALELTYGLTGDWAVGVEVPYGWKDSGATNEEGWDNPALFTKYRFWRHDMLGAQDSAAVLFKIIPDAANEAVGSGATDAVLGLTYGHESLTWYRWASVRYRYNGETDANLDRGDKLLLDIAAGYRPWYPEYYKPDTVFLLELNTEIADRAELNSVSLTNTGGTEMFLSPGVFWTYRNFAAKSGVQIPVFSDLNGSQDGSDYRASLTLEYHW